jgi:N-acetylglucosamine-6-sulfatase
MVSRIARWLALGLPLFLFAQCSSNDVSNLSAGGQDAGTGNKGDDPSSDDDGPGDAGLDSDADVAPPPPLPPGKKANVVFILTDDMSWNLVRFMPNLKKMQTQGTTFKNYFVTNSLCCPSRSSILTGKYPHGTGVLTNIAPKGGYEVFKSKGNETKTFGNALKGDTFFTAIMGKYLNGYKATTAADVPGWSEWALSASAYDNFDYFLNENGDSKHYGNAQEDYLTDVLSRKGSAFIKARSKEQNFLIELATFTPHAPYTPAPRHANDFPDAKVPRGGAYAVRPNDDDPAWLRAIPPLSEDTKDKLDGEYRKRAQSVEAIDDMIGKLRAAVADAGRTNDTYFIFSSDNGYHLGEHSLVRGKQTAFDHDIRVPLMVIGPGVPAGKQDEHIVANIDLCPTFTELGGVRPPEGNQGHSLVPLLKGENPADWRDAVLIEHVDPDTGPDDPDQQDHTPPSYNAIRTASNVYVEYGTGEKEFHDLEKDPDELNNTFKDLEVTKRQSFSKAVEAIKACTDAASCWKAEHLQ